MKHLSLLKVNYGSHFNESCYCDMAKKLDRGTIQMTDSYIEISSQNCSLESSLTLFEKDAFTETWKGTFSDGTSFRIVRPNKNLTAIIGDSLTIASMLKDGFAVHFDIR